MRFSTRGTYVGPVGLGYDAVGNDCQVFVNGALHWMAKHCHWIDEMVHMDSFILTFDVAAESFGEIMLPKGFELEEAPLSTLSDSGDRKSIALFVRNKVSGYCVLGGVVK
ncbi:hypothetical protein ACLB2K_008946 [Fragaria x ananassa]